MMAQAMLARLVGVLIVLGATPVLSERDFCEVFCGDYASSDTAHELYATPISVSCGNAYDDVKKKRPSLEYCLFEARFTYGGSIASSIPGCGTSQYPLSVQVSNVDDDGDNDESNNTVCCFSKYSECLPIAKQINEQRSMPCPAGTLQVSPATSYALVDCDISCRDGQYMAIGPQFATVDGTVTVQRNFTAGLCEPLARCMDDDLCVAKEAMCASSESIAASVQNFSRITDWNTTSYLTTVSCDSHEAKLFGSDQTVEITNVLCGPCPPSGKLTTSETAGIVLGVLLMIAVIIICAAYLVRKKKKNFFEKTFEMELQQKLLHEDMEMMEKGWQIHEDQIIFQNEIARGAFGAVWAGKWGHIEVAIKTLHQGMAELDPSSVEEFQMEAKRLQAIRHPNLVTFFGAGTTSNHVDGKNEPFLVFEYMTHGCLRHVLASSRQLPWHLRLRFANNIASGMQHLHNIPLIHRDLKSDNVLIDTNFHAKVADFGQSRILLHNREPAEPMNKRAIIRDSIAVVKNAISSDRSDPDLSTKSIPTLKNGLNPLLTTTVGTPLWKAPELLEYTNDYGSAIDVYSYGIIMWELLVRELPWQNLIAKNKFQFADLLRESVTSGKRPPIPSTTDCGSAYIHLMKLCWSTEPELRPDFKSVVSMLEGC